ncbi:MAG: zinc ABC transporter substrate-binding protein [Gammaproteobacteria bacterium RBG_16_51_14]|nr:MAG: zinc ABC transporter substrate-binding protein [Gammaproteobacteria bacterium RBG_16_51_14]
MNRTCLLTTFVVLLFIVRSTQANLEIFTCEPEWAALAGELGGSNVTTFSATTALQDPHQVQARPSLLARARRADLAVCTGAGLEIGWIPMIQRQAANPEIQPGQPGFFQAADYVPMLEVPARMDRSEGDIHAEGNPHIQTDPRNIGLVAKALAGRMAQLDPVNAAIYMARYEDFSARWEKAIDKWQQQAAPLKGTPIVVAHRYWVYLEKWLGLQEVATLESKPGLPPSSAHLAEVLAQLKAQPARVIVRVAYQDARPSEWLSERAGIPAVMLPGTVDGTPEATDLFRLFDDTIQKLLKAIQK